MARSGRPPNPGGPRRWPAGLLLAVGIAAGTLVSGCSTLASLRPGQTSPTVAGPIGTSRPPSTGSAAEPGQTVPTTRPAPSATTASPATTTPPVPLEPGSSGPGVLRLQQRLTSLGYWLGAPSGTFGDSTEQAVYALQKVAGLSRDGIVGPKTEAALAAGVVPRPRSTSGYVIEVDLETDLLMFVTNGRLNHILNTSTGGGYTYTDDGISAVADTPVGRFGIYRQVDGMVTDSLGQLWRPKFFDGGFAIHGDSFVPPYPDSHGCVRVSNEAIDWIWSDDLAPVGTAVWIY